MFLRPPTSTLSPYTFFFFNDTATTEIYTLSLHDALPICSSRPSSASAAHKVKMLDVVADRFRLGNVERARAYEADRKSTRLNSSHLVISYAVFCLKKKKEYTTPCHVECRLLLDNSRMCGH